MGRLASSLVVVGAVGFVALAAACASSGAEEPYQDKLPTESKDGGDSGTNKILGPKTDGGKSSSSSSGNSQGDDDDSTIGDDDDDSLGGPDGGTDAGPPPPPDPVVGAPCPTRDEIRKVACGFCGTKTTVCELGRDGSSTFWSGYSPCEGEKGECVAGSTRDEACNNCGTRTNVCSAQCKWGTGTCSTAPTAGCAPLSYDFTNAGCDGPKLGLYRVRQCDATCKVGNYSSCSAAPTTIEVGPTVGSVSSTITQLGGSISKISTGTCPATLGTTETPYSYVQVHNPLPTEATVMVFNSVAPAGKVFETAIAVYNGENAPMTVDARKACVKSSNSNGNVTYTGDIKFASLDAATKLVKIPADGTITVYTTAENAADSGPVRVSVRTAEVAKPAP